MNLEQEIREMLAKHPPIDAQLFEGLIAGSEVTVAVEDLLGIILRQNALEQAVLRLAEHVNQREAPPREPAKDRRAWGWRGRR